MPFRGHERHVSPRSANVSRFVRSSASEIDAGWGWNGNSAAKVVHFLYTAYRVLSCASNATAKSLWERVERLLDYLAEMFTLHPSSIKTNKGTLTPSSRRRLLRHHRHFLCRRLRLPLRLLPRRAVVERGHRQTDQKGLSRGILDVFCSCPMVRLVTRGKRGHSEYHAGGTVRTRARSRSWCAALGRQPGEELIDAPIDTARRNRSFAGVISGQGAFGPRLKGRLLRSWQTQVKTGR